MKIATSLLVLLLTTTVHSQDNRDSVIHNALLWEISGNGLSTASYLYGTTHLYCSDSIVIAPILEGKLLGSKVFFIETLLEENTADSLFHSTQNKKTLKKYLGNYCYKQAKEILTGYYGTIDDDSLNAMTPIKVYKMLTEAALNCRTTSYDDTLTSIAKNNNIPVMGLETIKDHFAPFEDLNLPPDNVSVCNFIMHKGAFISAVKRGWDLYQKHDVTTLYIRAAYLPNGTEKSKKNAMLDKRNKAWIPVIEASIKEHTSFFAFGCAHLAGRNGIISLLRQKGYRVLPVF